MSCSRDDGKWSLRHTFTFTGHNCPQGIAAVVHHPVHNLLIVGGWGQWHAQNQNSKTATALEYGITAWRILSGAPYYKMVTDYEHDLMTVRFISSHSNLYADSARFGLILASSFKAINFHCDILMQ